MYESFYGFREKPFSILPDASFLYLGHQHRVALSMLEYGVANDVGITLITGEIGCGKTTLIRHLLDNMDGSINVGLINNTHRSFGELQQWILLAFDLEHRDKNEVERHQTFIDFLMREYGKGRRTALIVDEAQNLGAETLEELRLLSHVDIDKHPGLRLILVGQPQLRATLDGEDLKQFVERIGSEYHLGALSAEETGEYIRHRIDVAGGNPSLFQDESFAVVHELTGGIPRRINILCDNALVYAFCANLKGVNPRIVQEVIRYKSELFEWRSDSISEGGAIEIPDVANVDLWTFSGDEVDSATGGNPFLASGSAVNGLPPHSNTHRVAEVSSQLDDDRRDPAGKGSIDASAIGTPSPETEENTHKVAGTRVSESTSEEKRRHERAAVNIFARVRTPSDSDRRFLDGKFKLTNLSLSGARVTGSLPLSLREKLEISLPAGNGRNILVGGRIVRVDREQEDHAAAVRFTRVSDQLLLSQVLSILLARPEAPRSYSEPRQRSSISLADQS